MKQSAHPEKTFISNPDWDDEKFYNEVLCFPEEKQSHRWSVSWSDLMMTMFVFFAVMYIYQTGNRNLRFGNGPGVNGISENGSGAIINVDARGQSADVYDQTRKAIDEIMLPGRRNLDLKADNAVRIVLASDLFFNSGQAGLKPGAKYQLNQIARVLDENPFVINIVGHTDDVPTSSAVYPTNWELSSKRAVNVARYLIEKKRIAANRIFVSAHASNQPEVSNDTARNRSINRRVEIILLKRKPYIP